MTIAKLSLVHQYNLISFVLIMVWMIWNNIVVVISDLSHCLQRC